MRQCRTTARCSRTATRSFTNNHTVLISHTAGGILPAGEPAFDLHFDDVPTIYVNGQPGRTDPNVRKLEHDIAALQEPDPYIRDAAATSRPST